ncbi:MAG: formyltetrahydrofolate deformylase [Cryomorphaceae bacterium]
MLHQYIKYMNSPISSSNKTAVASLLFSAADKVGIVASIADFFAQRNLNISRCVEYTDAGQFFSRLEWSLDDHWEDEVCFAADFDHVAQQYSATFSARFMHRKQTLGLFASSKIPILIDVLHKVETNYFPELEVSFIVGNQEPMRKIADHHGVPFFYSDTTTDALQYEKKQLGIIQRYAPDYIGLAGYMKVLSANFITKIGCPVINIKHSFMPSLKGADPFELAYERGVKLIGATSQYVTAELDHGPIIEQDVRRLSSGTSAQDMLKIGREVEQQVFAQALLKALEHKIIIYKNRSIVFD